MNIKSLVSAFALACLLPLSVQAGPRSTPELGEFSDPTQWGPYDVGVMEMEVRAPHQGLDNLNAWIWYPAAITTDDIPYTYMDDETFGMLTGFAVENADVDQSQSPYPSIVFSHGNGGLAYQSVFYTEFLASHGYVIISVDHPGNTLLDYEVTSIVTGAFTRPRDVSSEIDALEDINGDVGHLLRSHIDTKKLGMSGHSFGGYTTMAVSGAKLNVNAANAQCRISGDLDSCQIAAMGERFGPDEDGFIDLSDDRVVTAVPLAPCGYPVFGDAGTQFIDIPLQIQGSGRDDTCTLDEQIFPMYEALESPKSVLNLLDAGHYAWSDICLIEPTLNECLPPFLDMDYGHELINTWALSHFKVHLDGDDRYLPYLEESFAQDYSEVLTFEEELGL